MGSNYKYIGRSFISINPHSFNQTSRNDLVNDIATMRAGFEEAKDILRKQRDEFQTDSEEYAKFNAKISEMDRKIREGKKTGSFNPDKLLKNFDTIAQGIADLQKYAEKNGKKLSPMEVYALRPDLIDLYNDFYKYITTTYAAIYKTYTSGSTLSSNSKFVNIFSGSHATLQYSKLVPESVAKGYKYLNKVYKESPVPQQQQAAIKGIYKLFGNNGYVGFANNGTYSQPLDSVLDWYAPKSSSKIDIAKPKPAPTQTTKKASSAAKVLSVWDYMHPEQLPHVAASGVASSVLTPSEQALTNYITRMDRARVRSPNIFAKDNPLAGINASDFFKQNAKYSRKGNYFNQLHGQRRMARNATANLAYSGAAEFFQQHQATMRGGLYTPPDKPSVISKISKSLELLYRPIINLVKGIGDIAAEAKKMELAMSSLATALGNPFDEATLSGISGFGSAGISTSIGGAGAIGGAISGVGGGIGRMANDTWNLRGKGLTDAQNKGLSKAGGVLAAVSAALGIVGAAIGAVTSTVSAGFSISTSLLKSLNKITLKILGTSPLLETIKNILNLAFTMAFLPAMTLLEGKMLPIFLNLLNTMVKFGSSFTDDFVKFVPDIVGSFSDVVKYIVDFFRKNSPQIAEMVARMIQLLPDMMKMQLGIIELFVNNKDKILQLANYTIETLSKFIDQGLLDSLLTFAKDTMLFISKWGVPMAEAVLALADFFVKAADVTNDIIYNATHGLDPEFAGMTMASGGYVPATPGGVPAIIGEGGEGEYVIPESKMNGLGGVTIVFSGNVYGMNDFKQQVRSIMNEYTTKANFR